MRIWQTLGSVYRGLKKPQNALDCYKRSLSGSEDVDASTLAAIAGVYAEMKGTQKHAVTWYRLFMDDGRGSEHDIEKACLYLAQYYMEQREFIKTVSDLRTSTIVTKRIKLLKNKYLDEIVHTEEGKVIQRELKSLEKNTGLEGRITDWL